MQLEHKNGKVQVASPDHPPHLHRAARRTDAAASSSLQVQRLAAGSAKTAKVQVGSYARATRSPVRSYKSLVRGAWAPVLNPEVLHLHASLVLSPAFRTRLCRVSQSSRTKHSRPCARASRLAGLQTRRLKRRPPSRPRGAIPRFFFFQFFLHVFFLAHLVCVFPGFF